MKDPWKEYDALMIGIAVAGNTAVNARLAGDSDASSHFKKLLGEGKDKFDALRSRMSLCYSACEGVEDPVEAIEQARRALEVARSFIREVTASNVSMATVASCRDTVVAALAALTPSNKENTDG